MSLLLLLLIFLDLSLDQVFSYILLSFLLQWLCFGHADLSATLMWGWNATGASQVNKGSRPSGVGWWTGKAHVRSEEGSSSPSFPLSVALDPKLLEGRVPVCFYSSVYPEQGTRHTINTQEILGRPSLGVWRWEICLPVQGTWVWSLVQKEPTCHGAAGPMHHNSWSLRTREPMLHKRRGAQGQQQRPSTATNNK